MNKIGRRILLIISIVSFIGECICYVYLPPKIPIHWNLNWEIDQWADKKYIFLLGLLPILLIVIFEFLPKIDPKRNNYKKHIKAYDILENATVLLMIILNWATIVISLRINTNMKLIISAAIGIVFIVIGNYMPTLKSNYFIGIKNPWTLSNDVVWRKTHKIGGYIFTVSGVLMVMMAFFENKILNNITLFIIIVGLIGVNIYSYLLYRKV